MKNTYTCSNCKKWYNQYEKAVQAYCESDAKHEAEKRKIIAKFEAKNNELIEIIKQCEEKIALKDALCAKLEIETDRLRKIVNNNSSNSSIPPSKDIKPNKPVETETTDNKAANEFNGRIKTGKKSGGQVGHDGHTLNKSKAQFLIDSKKAVHEVIEHRTENSQEEYVSKYVIDVHVKTVVREHRFYKDKDGNVEIPKEYLANVQYGSELKCLTTALLGRGIVSSSRIRELISEISKDVINMSDGTVYNFLSEFGKKSKVLVEEIKVDLLNNKVLQVDETGARCESRNMCFRNYSNKNSVLYTANKTKGEIAVIDDNILPKFAGTLVHDHNTLNYSYGTNNAECNVHLLRYLRANTEHTSNEWSREMLNFFVELNNNRKARMQDEKTENKSFSKAELDEFSKRYDEIVERGFQSSENTKSLIYQKDEQRLLRRLKKYKKNHMLFTEDFDIPFDNNLSERDIRVVKIKQKVSGGFRSLDGAKEFANLLTVIKTSIRRKSSAYKNILNIFGNASPTFV